MGSGKKMDSTPIPDNLETIVIDPTKNLGSESGNNEVRSVPETQDYANTTDDLHLELEDTQLEPLTAMSQKELDTVWTQLQLGVPFSSWGPAPSYPLIEGFVTRKLEADESHGRILRMTTNFHTSDECDLPFESITKVIIHKHKIKSSYNDAVLDEKRVLSGTNRSTTSNSWTSSPPDLGSEFSTPQNNDCFNTFSQLQQEQEGYEPIAPHPPEVQIKLPFLPNGNIDAMHLQAMYQHAKINGESLHAFSNRVGLYHSIHMTLIPHQDPLIWLQLNRVIPEETAAIQAEYFSTYNIHQMSFMDWWETIGKNDASSEWQTGTATTRGEEYFRRKEVMHNEGHNLIQQLPEQIRPLAFQRFGMWSSALTVTHFSPFF